MESVDQINPKHYAQFGDYSPLHVIEKWDLNFRTGNAVKYIARAGHKDPSKHVEDLKKAKFYLEREIHLLDPSEPDPTERNKRLYSKQKQLDIGRCPAMACDEVVTKINNWIDSVGRWHVLCKPCGHNFPAEGFTLTYG